MSSVFLKLSGAVLNVLYEKELCIWKAHVCADGIAETNVSHIFRHTPGISSAQPSGGRQPQYAGNAWVCVCGPSALRPCIASEPATHAPARRQIWRGQSQWDKGTILIPHTITFTEKDSNADLFVAELNFLFMLFFCPWWTYLRGVRLYSSQIVLQGQAAIVVKYGLHSGKMSLHQPLPLSSNLLLQRLQNRLEVLEEERWGSREWPSKSGATLPQQNFIYRFIANKAGWQSLHTSFRACRSDFGRFFDWLSASAHSFMI